MAATGSNEFSSRSHCLIQIGLERRSRSRTLCEQVLRAKLCMVDLAGSERAAVSENRGIRMQEGANINRSLLALGNCINMLSDVRKKGSFIPYRDSKLTRLLKDSLGGNTQTIMLACIAPTYLTAEETVNTLKYANRARRIQRDIVQNVSEVDVHVSLYREIINSLRAEIDMLKRQLSEKTTTLVPEEDKQELANRVFANLEENWEIQQSLKDL